MGDTRVRSAPGRLIGDLPKGQECRANPSGPRPGQATYPGTAVGRPDGTPGSMCRHYGAISGTMRGARVRTLIDPN